MNVVRSIPILFLSAIPKDENRFSSTAPIDSKPMEIFHASFEALLASDCGAIFVFDNCSRVAHYINTFKKNKDLGKQIILIETKAEVSYVNTVNWFLRRIGEEFEIAGIMDSNFAADKEFCSEIISRMENADIAHGIPTFFRTAKVPFLPIGGWEQFIEQHPELKVT